MPTPRFSDIAAPVGRARRGERANTPGDRRTVLGLMEPIPAKVRGIQRLPSAYAPAGHFERLVEAFQTAQFGVATGRMAPGRATIAALNLRAAEAAGARPPPLPSRLPPTWLRAALRHLVDATRGRMVAEAARHLGAVDAGPAGPGSDRKRGADLLVRIHADTVRPADTLPVVRIAKAGDKPISWCGIYALWCLRNALKRIGVADAPHWKLGRGIHHRGFRLDPVPISGLRALGQGDICIVDETNPATGQFLNHHVIVAERTPGDEFATIEGNYWPDPETGHNQAIVRNRRHRRELVQVYPIGEFLDPVGF